MRLMLGLLAVAIATATTALFLKSSRNIHPLPEVQVTRLPPAPVPALNVESLYISRGDTLANLLSRAGVDQTAAAEMIAELGKKFDVRKLRVGSELKLARSTSGFVQSLEYVIDPDHTLELRHAEGRYAAGVKEIPSSIRVVPVCSTLEGSLFESIEKTGERAELAIQIAEIFAWDLDFYSDPREGDEFCIVLEKKEYENGQPPSYGRILAAKYINDGTAYDAFLFPDEKGKARFYSRDGRSLQASFLRSPMKFEARVSSRFSHRRFHPVLRRHRPHLGTDYAAPTGTPVQAVAAGRVVFSGRSGGSGNLVRIQHAGGYETYYLHLSRRYVRVGQQVQQGQRIGAVGATGLATGPHLDFRVRKNGAFVDFERLNFPRASSIAAKDAAAFAATCSRFSNLMEPEAAPNLSE
jgi:murein DD-endopeptidase MepM/ murein hydrolase activator NlpD